MLKCYGHTVRTQDNRWSERIVTWPPEGSGQRDRCEVRWEEAVEWAMKHRDLKFKFKI